MSDFSEQNTERMPVFTPYEQKNTVNTFQNGSPLYPKTSVQPQSSQRQARRKPPKKGFSWKTFWLTLGGILGAFLLFVIIFAVSALLSINKAFKEPIEVSSLDDYESGNRNVMLVGVDGSGRLADVIMLFSFSEDGKACVMSIPRDTRTVIGGSTVKINSAMGYPDGDALLVEEVQENTGIKIHEYVKVDFEAVKVIVDKLGGVKFNVPQDMDYEDPDQNLYIHLKAGEQKLNGDEALQLLRFRSGYAMADITRTEVQRDFMAAMFSQKANVGGLLKVPAIIRGVDEHMVSSMDRSDVWTFIWLAKDCVANFETIEMPHDLMGGYVVIRDNDMAAIRQQYFE